MQRVAVIDTDVHQGNGPARDKLHFRDADLAIVDLYNAGATCTTLQPGCDHAPYLHAAGETASRPAALAGSWGGTALMCE